MREVGMNRERRVMGGKVGTIVTEQQFLKSEKLSFAH